MILRYARIARESLAIIGEVAHKGADYRKPVFFIPVSTTYITVSRQIISLLTTTITQMFMLELLFLLLLMHRNLKLLLVLYSQ